MKTPNYIYGAYIVLGLASASLTGCFEEAESEDVGATSSLAMMVQNKAVTAASSLAGATATPITFSDGATTFTITEARMHVRDVRFDTSDSDLASEDTYTITGPYVMNLVDGTAIPSELTFNAPVGNYKRVDIRLDEANEGDGVVTASDELHGNALVIKGTHDYNGGANAGTFTLTVKVSEDIRFAPTNGIIVDTDSGADIVLNYRVTDWLENPLSAGTMIDLTSCVAALSLIDAYNHITLNEGTQCAGITESIGNLIKENMKKKYDFSSENN